MHVNVFSTRGWEVKVTQVKSLKWKDMHVMCSALGVGGEGNLVIQAIYLMYIGGSLIYV